MVSNFGIIEKAMDETKPTSKEAGSETSHSRAPLELSGNNAGPKTLRTFQSDLADTIKSGQGSVIKIAMAEHEKKDREEKTQNPKNPKNIALVIGGITLLLLGIGGIGYLAYLKMPKTVSVTREIQTFPSVIVVDGQTKIPIDGLVREAVGTLIGDRYLGATPRLNTIEQFLPVENVDGVETVLTTDMFFKKIESLVPGSLLRSLDPRFTLGVHAYDGNGLILVFKTNAYTTAMSGMLSWEKDMFDELYRLFGITITPETEKLYQAKFKDRIIKNQDTRVLTDEAGNIVLIYTFLGEDKDILVITNKETAMQEVVNRLFANSLRR